ncbi:M56 family metallopeptidase [Salinibacterium sp. NSLL150]|uniref:M56 family metallopeptidase n=1 Tax=unclassified Salinibacterium TaxID=2632331 RepID=UPI0018CF19BA|nr:MULTISPECIES: M56 family metallopeptidase [unclassified Salinibacterium]MBH0022594.1 M56 family metallopeptidase [Salinibacterium sp. SWN248]MBH0097605.1 M56 family metallopeptidase [Salinibacterium sp. NSLL35]MBH0100360.1 M56 family metallopeptidase [Salinibacterium sp. NSLL150]MBH0103119.1 M56 family metallopeptidase [Salinibacterium sp. NSLL16]MBH0105880.1 M56 family metallopeptidase [Salinibacterium sp. NSLL17]
MVAAAITLGLIAILLAWPLPALLAGATWAYRRPTLGLLVWQLVALVGGFSMIVSLVLLGAATFATDLPDAATGMWRFVTHNELPEGSSVWSLLALSGALFLTAHLLLNLLVTVVYAERERARHSQLITLLSEPMSDRPGTRVINTPAPVAYCLPGALTSITVLSAGLLQLLDEEELQAVIEHERAHVRLRHDIVLIFFTAWKVSLPWLPTARNASREVALLLEMHADDNALVHVGRGSLARAITIVSEGGALPQRSELSSAMPESTPKELRARLLRLA